MVWTFLITLRALKNIFKYLGIIDPNANHRLPVEIAYDRGLFDKRLHDILEDPSDDTRGFFDPNTEENLTYMELMERWLHQVDK